MPIYEYTCLKCKAHTEVLQKMTDNPLTRCRKCGGKLEKQWSQTSFQLKGTGWYVTDYAAKKSDATEKKSESAEKKSESPGTESVNSEAAPKSDGAEKGKKSTDSAKNDSAKSGDAAEKKAKKSVTTSSSSSSD